MDGVRPASLYQTRKTGPRFQRRLERASGGPAPAAQVLGSSRLDMGRRTADDAAP